MPPASPDGQRSLRLARTPLLYPVVPAKRQHGGGAWGSGGRPLLVVALLLAAVLAGGLWARAGAPLSSSGGAAGVRSAPGKRAAGGAPASSVWRRPAILLIGDSLTELGEDAGGGWASLLAAAFRRRADVLNRGFGGYNTETVRLVVCEITDSLKAPGQTVAAATLWLGANDAALPDGRDGRVHLPLPRYEANLRDIVAQLRGAGVAHVVLITPPPVSEDAPAAGPGPPRRLNVTQRYAAAARRVAADLRAPLLDAWALFEATPGWQTALLAPDGLHLSGTGQGLVAQALLALMEAELGLAPETLPLHHPSWPDLYTPPGGPAAALADEQRAYARAGGQTACALPGGGMRAPPHATMARTTAVWLLLALALSLAAGDEAPGGAAPGGAAAGGAAVAGAYLGNEEPTIWTRPAVLLLGDSLTELGLDPTGGWGVRLAHAYARKADVINRGFGGYTTPTLSLSLPEVLASTRGQKVMLATLWLGANDASRPDRGNAAAAVPVVSYAALLANMVRQLQAAGVANVVLITPPPVNEAAPKALGPGETLPARTRDYTAQYAAAARGVAAQMRVPLLDVAALFEATPGWQTALLGADGLHLSPAGQSLVFSSLMGLIEKQLPDVRPTALPWHHPTWWFVDYQNAAAQWGAEEAAYRAATGAGAGAGGRAVAAAAGRD
ncbi:Iah1 [Scenedesmus sp. PABB004]|nr:Iah1 [Scenedesmus sp. PABB004]